MPNIVKELGEQDGLRAYTKNGDRYLDIPYLVENTRGNNTAQRILSALLETPNLPLDGDEVAPGCFVYDRTATPYGDSDAVVVVKAGPKQLVIGVPGGQLFKKYSVGTTTSQVPTNFDRTQLMKPFKDRVPVGVGYTPEGGVGRIQTATFPYLAQNSTLVLQERFEATLEKVSIVSRVFSGKVNKNKWRGGPKNSWICFQLTGESLDGVNWDLTGVFGYDNVDFWRQTARYVDPLTGQTPQLTAKDIKAENGIRQIDVQLEEDFSQLPFEKGGV